MSPSNNVKEMADLVLRYLEESGAIRVDEDTVLGYKTVFEICSDCNIRDAAQWRVIKSYLNQIGPSAENPFSIVYVQGKGHFIGHPGEEITNDVSKYQIAEGWVKAREAAKERILMASAKQKFWIEKRHKDIKIDDTKVKVDYAERR